MEKLRLVNRFSDRPVVDKDHGMYESNSMIFEKRMAWATEVAFISSKYIQQRSHNKK